DSMMRGLILERALEVGPKSVAGSLEGLDLSAQPVGARLDGFLLHLEGSNLGVAGRNRGMRAGELAGEVVTLRLGRRPASSYFGEASGLVLPLTIERL